MKVILLQDVRNVGQKHQIKDVAEGYALNFLFPRKLAEVATNDKVSRLEEAHAADTAKREAEAKKVSEAIKNLGGARLTISVRATPKGGLFKSIGAAEIARAIAAEKGVTLPAETIELGTPLKTTGEHAVNLKNAHAHATLTISIEAQS